MPLDKPLPDELTATECLVIRAITTSTFSPTPWLNENEKISRRPAVEPDVNLARAANQDRPHCPDPPRRLRGEARIIGEFSPTPSRDEMTSSRSEPQAVVEAAIPSASFGSTFARQRVASQPAAIASQHLQQERALPVRDLR